MSEDRQPTLAQWAAARKRAESKIADALQKVRYREAVEAMKKPVRPT
jgi:hypothetical protein